MNRPETIFQYQACSSRTLDNISKKQVWFSDPKHFNDPFDCARSVLDFLIRSGFENIDPTVPLDMMIRFKPNERERLEKQLSKNLNRLAEIMSDKFREKFKDQMGRDFSVCCFSGDVKNLLMWGHYAERHQGCCLEYDTSDYPFDELVEVKYSGSFPKPDLGDLSSHALGEFLTNLIVTKSKDWSYEHEWRIFKMSRSEAVPCDDALKAVYFGLKTTEENRAKIAHALKGRPMRYYEMQLSESKFEMEPIEMPPAAINDLHSV